MDLLKIKFGEMRKYLDIVSYITIRMNDAHQTYANYPCSVDVPHTYDDYYVYGVGLTEEMFDDKLHPGNKDFFPCIEVILNDTPREYEEPKKKSLFGKEQ